MEFAGPSVQSSHHVASGALGCSPDELRQLAPTQRVLLTNMLVERMRRHPPPTPEEIQGIQELAAQMAPFPGRRGALP